MLKRKNKLNVFLYILNVKCNYKSSHSKNDFEREGRLNTNFSTIYYS